jgi:hypothetical protein
MFNWLSEGAQASAVNGTTKLTDRFNLPFLPMSVETGLIPDDHPRSVAAATAMRCAQARITAPP